MELEEISGAGIDAFAAGGTVFLPNHGKAVLSHIKGIELTRADAIPVPHTPERALFVSPYQMGGVTGRNTLINTSGLGRIQSAAAMEAGDLFDDLYRIHAQD